MTTKQGGMSSTPTRHSTDITQDPEKSKKGEGVPETAKSQGTVSVNRPTVSSLLPSPFAPSLTLYSPSRTRPRTKTTTPTLKPPRRRPATSPRTRPRRSLRKSPRTSLTRRRTRRRTSKSPSFLPLNHAYRRRAHSPHLAFSHVIHITTTRAIKQASKQSESRRKVQTMLGAVFSERAGKSMNRERPMLKGMLR